MAHPTKEEFLEITDKYLNNTASVEEVEVVEAYYQLFSTEPEVLEKIAELGLDPLEKKMRAKISERIKELERVNLPGTRSYQLWYRLAGAAIVLISLSVGLYFYVNRSSQYSAMNIVAENDIKPGKNSAVLTLANGKQISLTDGIDGKIADEKGTAITKTKSGQLIYDISELQRDKPEVSFNMLTTPKGGQFQVQLPDGTIVWLNAASVIKFPTTFSGMPERKVVLSGEAYFEVARVAVKGADGKHISMPFIVETEKQRVEVLGTHFNINAYHDEGSDNTTLLEGSVRVAMLNLKGEKSAQVILKPNQQSVLTTNGIRVNQVDAEQAVAWKSGLFMFEGESLDYIMKKIARWYDVDIHFENEELKQKIYSGSFSRFTNVSQVLQKIELTHTARFNVKGRKITLYKY
ncbi:MAG: FecR domain-containing protein [Pedobacter sp.]|uniref:FecR family protein n=1 Tax=Pedobacter sp. TaxID=1411316 RepID=UPI0035637981